MVTTGLVVMVHVPVNFDTSSASVDCTAIKVCANNWCLCTAESVCVWIRTQWLWISRNLGRALDLKAQEQPG